jgi:hypothetical protein
MTYLGRIGSNEGFVRPLTSGNANGLTHAVIDVTDVCSPSPCQQGPAMGVGD